jgi:4-aminobutyrate aminotransferase / (S)-3-amino-2-methylpropionate transaminase / 5-aminovalerate transaminase
MSIGEIPIHPVQTRHRSIQSKELPTPEMLGLLEDSRRFEPVAMQGQPPIVWDRAEGFNIYDRHGNKWLDFSSGVLVTNAGHGRKEIADAIIEQTRRGLLHSYIFPNELRVKLARRISELAPEPLKKTFLLSTGSETTECAVKLMRTHGLKIDPNKTILVSFSHAFHGRTLGAQLIGGIPALKEWIGPYEVGFVQAPFPDGFRCEDQSFDYFKETLAAAGVSPAQVAGVITETYQGGGASFAPPTYIRQLREWCDQYQVILTFDEVQAGFGRCGKMWGFEHYGVLPDLMCLGKGISSSLPVAALVGRPDLMDLYPPGSMTSTHSGSPVCCAAALANIDLIVNEKLIENAAQCGEVMHRELWRQLKPFDARIGAIHGKGLVAGIHCIKDDSNTPDKELAQKAVWNCVGRGLMLFSPVGVGGGTIKICPPLCITEDAVVEGVSVIAESLADALK